MERGNTANWAGQRKLFAQVGTNLSQCMLLLKWPFFSASLMILWLYFHLVCSYCFSFSKLCGLLISVWCCSTFCIVIPSKVMGVFNCQSCEWLLFCGRGSLPAPILYLGTPFSMCDLFPGTGWPQRGRKQSCRKKSHREMAKCVCWNHWKRQELWISTWEQYQVQRCQIIRYGGVDV